MKILKAIAFAIILFALLLLLGSCSLFFNDEPEPEPEPDKELTANDYVYERFLEWYYWYDEIPEIDPNEYETINDVVDAIVVDVDRWSYAGSYTEVSNLFSRGEMKGFGAGFLIDSDSQIKVTHVFSNSPFGTAGIERGWVVESVNGYTIDDLANINYALSNRDTIDFVFTDLDETQLGMTVVKESFSMNTVLHYSVFDHSPHKIGYLVFSNFVETSKKELEDAFTYFKNQGINNLIVDVRYNGGGSISTANVLTAMIGGYKVAGKVLTTTSHNDKKSSNNQTTISRYDGVFVNIDKVHFITTHRTASASEMVINNLVPYMDVSLVGSATHGKPVGMYVFSVVELDLAILPVSFINKNMLGYGEYYDGIEAQISVSDDLSRNWGDPEERMLKTAITEIIDPGAIAVAELKSSLILQQQFFDYQKFYKLTNSY